MYWAPPTKSWHRVELLVVPSDSARRVRIQHLDDRAAAEWVPVSRLRVPWTLREPYLAREERWDRVSSHRGHPDDRDAAWDILGWCVSDEVADLYAGGGAGVLEIFDIPGLSRATGLSTEILLEHEDCFEEDGAWYAPWPMTSTIATALAQRHAGAIFERIEAQERALRAGVLEDAEAHPPFAYMSAVEQETFVKDLLEKRGARREGVRTAMLRHLSFDGGDLADEYRALQRRHDALAAAVVAALPLLSNVRTKKAAAAAARLRDALVQ